MRALPVLMSAMIFAGCQNNIGAENVEEISKFDLNTKVVDVIEYKNFSGFGRLIFPANREIDGSMTLKNLGEIYQNAAKSPLLQLWG